uniref:MI domain-containing protein n=1 Tax=Steinernema glaseri TaxID=37863 RepID=A0A1I7Z6K5_9BILA
MERKRSAEVLGQKEGAYIPPAKLRMLQGQMVDKNSEESQRVNWERLKKKIHGQVNKVNAGNVVRVVRDLLKENVVRGKGLLVRSIIQAQAFSPTFSGSTPSSTALGLSSTKPTSTPASST